MIIFGYFKKIHYLCIYRDRLAYEDAIEQDKKETAGQSRAEGIAEGKAEGRAEEKREMALNFKAMGFPLEAISKASGLSIEEIEKL